MAPYSCGRHCSTISRCRIPSSPVSLHRTQTPESSALPIAAMACSAPPLERFRELPEGSFWPLQVARAREAVLAGHTSGYRALARTVFAAYEHTGEENYLSEALYLFRSITHDSPHNQNGTISKHLNWDGLCLQSTDAQDRSLTSRRL
jgi:hypothetical protein